MLTTIIIMYPSDTSLSIPQHLTIAAIQITIWAHLLPYAVSYLMSETSKCEPFISIDWWISFIRGCSNIGAAGTNVNSHDYILCFDFPAGDVL